MRYIVVGIAFVNVCFRQLFSEKYWFNDSADQPETQHDDLRDLEELAQLKQRKQVRLQQ